MSDPVSYTVVLPAAEETVLFVSRLLAAEYVLAAAAPGLRGALLAARAVGHSHVSVDGTLIRSDRCHVPDPTARADRAQAWLNL